MGRNIAQEIGGSAMGGQRQLGQESVHEPFSNLISGKELSAYSPQEYLIIIFTQ